MVASYSSPSPRRFLTVGEIERVEFIFKYLTESVGSDMSESNLEYLISIQSQYKKDGKLSDKQLEVLETIYAKY